MGGKKKKSAAAPTSVQPAAVNATNAATESTGNKQQQRPNNDKSTSKENKPRGQTSFYKLNWLNRTIYDSKCNLISTYLNSDVQFTVIL